MRPVKAILIDPFACTVTEVEHDADEYHNELSYARSTAPSPARRKSAALS
jgi:hypothetical protein